MTCRSHGGLHPCQKLGTAAERGEREENATAPIDVLSAGLEMSRNSSWSPLQQCGSMEIKSWARKTESRASRSGLKQEPVGTRGFCPYPWTLMDAHISVCVL